jgi:hypothetical protein
MVSSCWPLVVGSVLLLACAGRPNTLRPPAAVEVGCFRVNVDGRLAHALPDVIELRREPSACPFARGRLVLLGSRDGQSRLHGHWSAVNAGEVTADWGTDLFGVFLRLRPEGSGLGGTATTVRDVGDDDAPVAVHLRATPCS